VVETLGYADGVPLVVSSMHLPEALFPGIQERLAGFTTFTDLSGQYRLSNCRRELTRIHAMLPDDTNPFCCASRRARRYS
jgi:DNA-binding GntR family transcriptional regulator